MTATQNSTIARDETSNDLIGAYNLFKAVQNRDVEEVARLLASGVDADAWGKEDRYGNLPLQVAAMIGGADGARIVGLLLDAGADIDYEGDYNSTALHRAVYVDHEDGWATARLLVRRGANVGGSSYDKDGCNAAEAALLNGDQGAVLAMLEEGISPDTMGIAGPLIWYAAWDSPEVVRKLLEMGVPADIRCQHGTPLMRAAESISSRSHETMEDDLGFQCFRLLIEAGADPAEKNGKGMNSWDILGDCPGLDPSAVEARLSALEIDPCAAPGKDRAGRRV